MLVPPQRVQQLLLRLLQVVALLEALQVALGRVAAPALEVAVPAQVAPAHGRVAAPAPVVPAPAQLEEAPAQHAGKCLRVPSPRFTHRFFPQASPLHATARALARVHRS